MAYGTAQLKNETTNQLKTAPIGYSWTVLFFSAFPALFRSDWKWAIIMFALHMITMGLSVLVFSFIYNKFHLKDALMNGFRITNLTGASKEQVAYYVGMDMNQFMQEDAPAQEVASQ